MKTGLKSKETRVHHMPTEVWCSLCVSSMPDIGSLITLKGHHFGAADIRLFRPISPVMCACQTGGNCLQVNYLQ